MPDESSESGSGCCVDRLAVSQRPFRWLRRHKSHHMPSVDALVRREKPVPPRFKIKASPPSLDYELLSIHCSELLGCERSSGSTR